ncbi:hypothetical protein PspS35_18205 [Pseudomonas sp. S35]|uniref:DUF6124 family protein n=1 Tax=Pseudomonas sp. S35 TaxID=1573719 RepID=UPI00132E9142|nr:DUF3077 domain-containing protein [Pseudomonas sp. S35]QHF45632.1 hypothetical protein PspS35_18205 [Pseudomonas sp. S35]
MTTSPHHLPETPENDELHGRPNRCAARRAWDLHLKEDMSARTPDETFFAIKPGISQEEALVHASDLLRSAAATAYESANSQQGNQRDLAFSVVFLIDMAKAMVERSLHTAGAQAST